jgi:hypothetical protein
LPKELERVLKIMFRLWYAKISARQPLQVNQMNLQQVRENLAPVPHAPSSSLGSTQITQKHKEKKPFVEKLLLFGQFLTIMILFVLTSLFFKFLLTGELSDDFFTFDNLTTPWVHAMFMVIMGMAIYVSVPLGATAMLSLYSYKNLTFHSPISRKHLVIFSMLKTEIILIPVIFLSSIFLSIILWDQLSNPILFLFLSFFGFYLTIRVVYVLISILTGSSEIPKRAIIHRLRGSANLLFMIIVFFPILLFLYRTLITHSLSASWITMNESPLAQFTLMLPNSVIILISEDIWILTKTAIVLLLLGLNISLSYIQYALFSTTKEVTWKRGYVFHKKAESQKQFKDMHGRPRISSGWDPKEEKGLKALDRIPIRLFKREQNAIEVFMGVMVVFLLFFIFLTGLHPVLIIYSLLLIPFIFPIMIVMDWGIFLSGEGLKFFKLFPFSPRDTTKFLTAFIEKRSIVFAVLFAVISYIPIWFIYSVHLVDFLLITIMTITIFVGCAILFYTVTIFKIKNAASPQKGHILNFVAPIFYKPQRTSGFVFTLLEIISFIFLILALFFSLWVISIFPLTIFATENILLLFFNITLFVSFFLFIRSSYRDNMLAFLSNNRKHVRFEEKWIPFITIISSLVGLTIFFFIPYLVMIGIF